MAGPVLVSTCQAQAGETGGGGALLGTNTRCLELAGVAGTPGPQLLWLWCTAQERGGGGGGRERWAGGQAGVSAAQFVARLFFFFPFSPFFLSKKCTKARQPLCNDQQCFLRVGLAGRGPRAWQPSLRLKGGLILLRNVSQFKYQTKNRAWRTTLTVAKSLPERTASINKKIEIFTSR